jgi:hypothetical protein
MDEIGKPTGISVRIAQALADFSAAFEALADGVRWGRWPVALARTQAFLQRFGLASLQDLTATLLASNRPAITATIAMFFLPVTRNAATAMVIF